MIHGVFCIVVLASLLGLGGCVEEDPPAPPQPSPEESLAEEADLVTSEQAVSVMTSGKWPGGVINWTLEPADYPAGVRFLSPHMSWPGQDECRTLAMPSSSSYGTSSAGRDNACQDIADLLEAMAIWQQEVPGLTFPFVPSGSTSSLSNFMRVHAQGTGSCSWNQLKVSGFSVFSVSGHIGMQPGTNHLRLKTTGGCSAPGIVHELGHALGLWHTGGRNDRNDHIDYIPSMLNVLWQTQYRIPGGFQDIGPFDFDSIMLYDSYDGRSDVNRERRPVVISVNPTAGTIIFDVSNLYQGATGQTEFLGMNAGNLATPNPGFTLGSFTGWAVAVLPRSPTRFPGSPMPVPHIGVPDENLHLTVSLASLGLSSEPIAALEDPSNWTVARSGSHGLPAAVRKGLDPTVDHDATFQDTTELSPGDISGVYHSYSNLHDQGQPAANGEEYGDTLVYGDFNGDGLQDLAVGVPDDAVTTGSVVIYRGVFDDTTTGRTIPMPWRIITNIKPRALAAGDLNGDGLDELVVGTRDTSKGTVEIFMGKTRQDFARGGDSHQLLDPLMLSPNAEYGAALAIGDLNADGFDDLVVGAPDAKAVHQSSSNQPNPRPPGWPSAFSRTGRVLIHHSRGAVNTDPVETGFAHSLDPYLDNVVGSQKGARFGHAITLFDFDDNGILDILVGAPGAFEVDSGTNETNTTRSVGQVYLFEMTVPVAMPVGVPNPIQPIFTQRFSENEEQSEFGAALAQDGAVILIGAPNSGVTPVEGDDGTGRAGAVFVYDVAEFSMGVPVPDDILGASDFSAACPTDGDRFGEVLAAGLVWTFSGGAHRPTPRVAVGAPQKNNCTGDKTGAVFTYKPDTIGGLTYSTVRALNVSTSVNPISQNGDRFGQALAFRPFNTRSYTTATEFPSGQLELAVGAPGEQNMAMFNRSGVVWMFEMSMMRYINQ